MTGESTLPYARPEAASVVLVVEDDIIVRTVAAEFLRDSGFHVTEAANVAEAMGILTSGVRVDVVFSDINMPGEDDGHALAQWLTEHRPAIRVLLTSGSREEMRKSRYRAIAKPYSLIEIDRILKSMSP